MKYLYLAIIFMIAGVSHAQIKITGTIKDSIGSPLEMANIIAVNSATKALDSYGFTDAAGRYKLTLKKNTEYTLKVSYIGFKAAEIVVSTKEIDLIQEFNLLPDTTLDEVNISYKMPVTIKGDTIVYDADSFKVGTEKKLGDVLKRLPGVEVNANGEIKVEGKKVNKVMVEGKDFFDGDSKIATKNIPSDAIDKVEILKNFSEVGQLKNVTDNQDNVAINIKLKEGKKNFWFGEITAGAGADNRFIAHPKLFYYNPKYSLNFITDFNNIGKIPFTMSDYFRFSGGFKGAGNRGTGFNVGSSDIGFLAIQNNKAKEIEANFGAANFSYSPQKNWDLSGFAIYSGNKTEIAQQSSRNYIESDPNNPNVQLIEKTSSTAIQKTALGLLKLSSFYKPNSDNQLEYDFFAKISNQSENQRFVSSQITGEALENMSQNPYSINQSLNYYHTANDRNIFAFSAQYLAQDEDPFYNANLQQLSFANLLGLSAPVVGNSFDVSQEKRVKTNKLDANLEYYYILNSKSNLNLTAGITTSDQKFNSSIFETLNGSRNQINNPLSINNVSYAFSDIYLGAHYKFITGIFTFNQGLTFHQYEVRNTQKGSMISDNFIKLLPDFSIKLQLKKSETLNFSYNQRVNFTNIYSVSEAYVLNNYNRLYAGNRNLESELSHNLQLNYFSFNMFNYTNVFANINYNKRIGSFVGNTIVDGINQVATTSNSIFPNESLSGAANMQKSIGKFKGTIGASISWSKFTNTINSYRDTDNDVATPPILVPRDVESLSFTQSYKTMISTNFRSAPNFEIGYDVTINKYQQGFGLNNSFINQSPFFNLDILFLKDFRFTSRYTYNKYSNDVQTLNEYSFLDLDLTYQKEDSKWEYTLEMTNALDTQVLNTDSSNAIFNSTSSYEIQPRFVVFSIKYNL